MTIWFSTNIPEMRAISTFNKVSTDISEIQHRITTGQRINSGKDDPGGLIIREGLRADIKEIQATQANMMQAENLMDTAASGMMQLLELLRGTETNDPSKGGLLGELYSSSEPADKQAAAENFLKLYEAVTNSTMYKGEQLIGGATATQKTYQLGAGETLDVTIPSLALDTSPAAMDLATAISNITDEASVVDAAAVAKDLMTAISKELGKLGSSQNIVATNQNLLNSRLTSVTAAEGRISNADIAVESSRMARAELLAQNAMSSIMYTRSYAAFAVSSLFR